jgi:hypothetical protein
MGIFDNLKKRKEKLKNQMGQLCPNHINFGHNKSSSKINQSGKPSDRMPIALIG